MHIFIHIPKNGGTSIRMSPYLKNKVRFPYQGDLKPGYYNQYMQKMKEINEAQGIDHVRWKDLNGTAKRMPAFAIVRNPWSKVISRYHFAKQVIADPKSRWDSSYADVRSLETFLEERHKWRNQEYLWARAVKGWYNQLEHVTDEENNVRCDIMRFESIIDEPSNKDNDVFKYFNIKETRLKARNVTTRDGPKKILRKNSYMEEYTPETIQIVADWYKDDIDYWGFDFDTGATRNYWAENK